MTRRRSRKKLAQREDHPRERGLGGLLVPADRFHGWEQETLKRIEQGHGADFQDLLSPEERALELFKVVSVDGQPAVYLNGEQSARITEKG